jgi:hypothetical protein
MQPVTLSKSSFAAGLQCQKRLWIEKRNRELVPQPSAARQAVFDQGHEVGTWSHRLFPDGILLSGELDFKAHIQASRDALLARRPLFEPAFAIPGAYARADILTPVGTNEWDLLEVKSASNVWENSGKVKAVYLQDVAFQLYVYRAAGVKIRDAFLVFLNRDYVRRGDIELEQLFRQQCVTQEAEALLPMVSSQLLALSEVLQMPAIPGTSIGPHCSSPYECGLVSHCWKSVPMDSVFTLTRGGDRTWKWWNSGVTRIVDLPIEETYSRTQTIQIAAERSREVYLDAPAIRHFLQGLRYPLHFLDFETIMPGVPMFNGCRPYGQVPFQFSLHVQQAPDGEASHIDFLADASGDPRPHFLLALKKCLGQEGSIVAYNSSFERSRMKELGEIWPEDAEWLEAIQFRCVEADLLKPFRDFSAYHPDQRGSASIKAVLPAFTELGYGDLEYKEGGTASNQFLRLLKGTVPEPEIAALRQNLSLYCERDTWAMVTLVKRLRGMVG